ncbi:MAG TPA: methyltransferase domain-containing protein, partial [Chloroflexota bacterium]|nr:methyltransferase domain-containing protein [Chloroflexota bacterium]
RAGVSDRVRFEVASAYEFPTPHTEARYDLVAFFDSFHDLGDPVRAARRAYETLAPDGTLLLVEPSAADTVAENLNPVGRLRSAAATLVCIPNALAEGETALGQLFGFEELRAVLEAGGFTRVRQAIQTPFNRVFEARR